MKNPCVYLEAVETRQMPCRESAEVGHPPVKGMGVGEHPSGNLADSGVLGDDPFHHKQTAGKFGI